MKNSRNYYTTSSNYEDHSTFGGEITIEDFSTCFPNKKRISNQIDGINLSETIKKEQNKKNEEKKYKNMTFEELKKLRLISNTNGRPTSSMTDEKWQKEFNLRKLFITPHPKEITEFGGMYSREYGIWNEETRGIYHGRTNWQEYCRYINDILRVVRSGQVDYCYFIYQIMDLAKFNFGNRELKTKYCDGYWEVWLESSSKVRLSHDS